MWIGTYTIKALRPGHALDSHVHDVLGVPEPVWPYSTHPKAQPRLREWLKSQGVSISMPGQDRASDHCVILFRGYREAFEAVSENHALCLTVLLCRYLSQDGRRFTVTGRY